MTFDFPWPHRELSPNARVDRWTKAKRVKAYRTGVAWEAKAAGVQKLDAPAAHLRITFCPPDARRRDLDNMLASIKPALDGLSDVLGVDDSRWSLTIERGPVVARGRVRIAISLAQAEAVQIPLAGQIS